MQSDFHDPINLGQDRMISMDDLVHLIESVAEYSIEVKHIPGPEGVRGRNSDNTLLRKTLNWEPAISLEEGIEHTYLWIEDQIRNEVIEKLVRMKTSEIYNGIK